jgi:hypothetical protein
MRIFLALQLLSLLAIANTAPLVAKRLWGNRFAYPIDGGVNFIDGRPLLGRSKTVRGALSALGATMVGSWLLGLGPVLGALVGITAMAGDLLSSFVKRRLALPPSSQATGLDQIPESLLPLLACSVYLELSVVEIGAVAAVFFVGEVLLSVLFFRLGLRDRPY